MDKLGIQPSIIITQVINFAILAALLWKFLYKPVIKVLDSRKHKIEEDLKLSQSLKEQQAETATEKTAIISEAHIEAANILTAAKKMAKESGLEEIETAKKVIAKERAKMQAEMESLLTRERAELKKEVVSIASALTTKIISESLDKKAQSELLDTALTKLKKLHAK